MRAWTVLVLLLLPLLSGCARPDDDGAGAGDAFVPPEPEPAPPAVLPLWNGTLTLPAPGGSGAATFTVPASGYQQLFVNTRGPVRILGNASVSFVAPDGSRTVYLEGAFVQDDAAGVAAPGASLGETRLRIQVQGDAWRMEWRVDGEMELPLFVEAL